MASSGMRRAGAAGFDPYKYSGGSRAGAMKERMLAPLNAYNSGKAMKANNEARKAKRDAKKKMKSAQKNQGN